MFHIAASAFVSSRRRRFAVSRVLGVMFVRHLDPSPTPPPQGGASLSKPVSTTRAHSLHTMAGSVGDHGFAPPPCGEGLGGALISKSLVLIAVPRPQTLADAVGDFEEFGGLADVERAFLRQGRIR